VADGVFVWMLQDEHVASAGEAVANTAKAETASKLGFMAGSLGLHWPTDLEPTYAGYSIGRWIDEDGDGVYDVLEVETRGPFKGPRAYDATGLPLHFDNQSVFKERIFRDKGDLTILHDEVTVIDHALTRPWTVDKKYTHNPNPRPRWTESSCIETNSMVAIGRDSYFMSADGMLMPVRKNQPVPDLRYFKQWTK
jgi:hypothetical protein